jgi:type IV pilus assembly protein PilW
MPMDRITKRSDTPASEKGFTLVELLVSMAISLVVMGAVYSTYRSQQNSYVIQDQVAAAQQNLRAAMYTMKRDIQMAGFDPSNAPGAAKRTATFGVIVANDNSITITSDNGTAGDHGNGAVDPGERIQYSLTGSGNLIRNAGGGDQTLAENIVAIGFAYAYGQTGTATMTLSANNNIIWAISSNNDGQLDTNLDTNDDGVIDLTDAGGANAIAGTALGTPVSIQTIKSVKIWLLARTAQQFTGYQDTNRYVVGKTVVTPQQGFMYRLLTETAKCRNLYL